MEITVCRIEDCEKPVEYKYVQLCNMHYERQRLHGSTDANLGREAAKARNKERRLAELAKTEKECSDCKMVKPVEDFYLTTTAEGHPWRYKRCKDCHNAVVQAYRAQNKRNAPPKTPKEKIDRGLCAFEGCKNKAVCRLTQHGGPEGWYCDAHRWQQQHKGELTPLQQKNKSYISEQVRVCTGCDTAKAQTQFYKRTKNNRPESATDARSRQSKCRDCMSKASKFSLYMRQGQHAEAKEIVESMDEPQRSKYEIKYQERMNSR